MLGGLLYSDQALVHVHTHTNTHTHTHTHTPVVLVFFKGWLDGLIHRNTWTVASLAIGLQQYSRTPGFQHAVGVIALFWQCEKPEQF